MLATDFAEFESVLRAHSQVYAKKLTDEIVQGYWGALKDMSLPTVKRCADNHLRFGKFFPKPIDLRPKDESPTSVKEDKSFKAAVEQNIRNWEDRLRLDPESAKAMLQKAYDARATFRGS